MKLLRLAYSCLLILLIPYIVIHLLWRGRKQPAYLQHVGERFGIYPISANNKVIWLHAVSVGETRAAVPLIKALQASYPAYQILLTHMTPTGCETGRALFGDEVFQCYLPYDFPFAVKSFLRHFKPVIGLLMETEIWFNLIHQAKVHNVPMFLINTRMSEKSAQRYARFSRLTRHSLTQLSAIAAQTEVDSIRLKLLGAPTVTIMGNLKFDVQSPDAAIKLGYEMRHQFGSRPVFLAASTREGEEILLLEALQKNPIPELLTVIVPRHPQRFSVVAELLTKRNICFQLRSENHAIKSETQVLLGDTMGEMFTYYHACDLAFIGGSLLPYGSQNLIEACAAGKPVIIGPSTYNFAEAAELAIQGGAAVQVSSADELMVVLKALLADKQRMEVMAAAGRTFYQAHQGATAKVMAIISPYLTES